MSNPTSAAVGPVVPEPASRTGRGRPTAEVVAAARTYVYRNARPVELARWRFHLEGGSADDVVRAVAVYQNPDGGFGHGLEADNWNPASTPVATAEASRWLTDVGCLDRAEPVVAGLLRYLESGQDFDGDRWAWSIPSNADHPHAPWWSPGSGGGCHAEPTSALAGFYLAAGDPAHPFYATALRLAGQAADDLARNEEADEYGWLHAAADLLHHCRRARITAAFDVGAYAAKLVQDVRASIHPDPSTWASGYEMRPSHYLAAADDVLAPALADLISAECEILRETQEPDGSWPIGWQWADAYPADWPVALRWWKARQAVDRARFLTAFAPGVAQPS